MTMSTEFSWLSVPIAQRLRLAEQIDSLRDELAKELTEAYLHDHQGFETRFSEARQRTREDFAFILEFLGSALAAGSPEAFAEFVRWTQRVLVSRGVPPTVLEESLDRVAKALRGRIDDELPQQLLEYGRAQLSGSVPDATDMDSGGSRLFLQAILAGDRRLALKVVHEALQQGLSLAEVYVTVIQEAMYEVGCRWERNEITVADEHLATAVTQYVLANLYDRIDGSEQDRGRAVVTGIEGESHQLGANMVADMLEADGWDVRFLGANVPSTSVLAALDEHDPELVGISATMLFNVPKVAALIAAVRGRSEHRPRIVVGGAAFRMAPHLAEEIGADAVAEDVQAAVATVRELFSAA